ncbi:phage holin family protein [Fredinandcohnia sp. 179-A 10B2 NHS]|uniref:phage holin family protein n=1 Tax=Fredinandcohnia sp. 179-A 10B2 NHS TaxID=3235176 RepID=UPI00399EFA56
MNFYLGLFNFSGVFNLRNGFASVLSGAIGGLGSKLYGGSDLYVWFAAALVFAILFDWAGAIAAAKKDGSYASEYGLQGILRTAVLLALPAWGAVLDKILGTPNVVFFTFWGGIMFHTLLSMSANFKRAGWNTWVPTWAIDWVASEIEAKIKRSESRTPNGEGEDKK